jgi:hypothetical protein
MSFRDRHPTCRSGHVRRRLTHRAEEIQGVEVGGELGPGHTRERDHDPPRRQQDPPVETARY